MTATKNLKPTKLTPWTYHLSKPFYGRNLQKIECKNLDHSRNRPLMNDNAVLGKILAQASFVDQGAGLLSLGLAEGLAGSVEIVYAVEFSEVSEPRKVTDHF